MRFDRYGSGGRASISFELFPPKTDAAMSNLRQILPELVALSPDLITVTYGALGSTRARTLEIARLIQQDYGVNTACHLTCVGSSRDELDGILEEIVSAGIRNVVALRGDPPQGEATFIAPPDGYRHADALVTHIRLFEARRKLPRFAIAVAGYPEKHPEATDFESDLRHLRQKVENGGDLVITQLFYDNPAYFRYAEAVKKSPLSVPVVPGLLPIVSVKQILRITSLCGSSIPPELRDRLELAKNDDALAEEIGIDHCVKQAKELLASGVSGLHFYVLNRVSHIKRIMEQLRS